MAAAAIRVLAVDDSAVARTMYRELLAPEQGFELVATAPNADIARRKIMGMDPDVVILDIEMPGEDGLSLLKWLMEHFPVPVVVSSSFSPRGAEQTMRAFSLGAVDVVCKSSAPGANGERDFRDALTDAVRAGAAARAKMRRGLHRAQVAEAAAIRPAVTANAPLPPRRPSRRGPVVVMGASTGGTEVLARMVLQMPADFPPVLVVQHMPPIYTRAFAQRLDTLGAVRVEEARDGLMIGHGQVVIAPGGMQMRVQSGASGPVALVRPEPPVNRHAPSVDVLFNSAADLYRSRLIGVLLTGMGNDGAQGLLRIRQAGGRTIAQDEASSVVWGMPQEAVKLGAADAVLAADQVIPRIQRWLEDAGPA
jgi:two-component system chemotaxis response regulator CheB